VPWRTLHALALLACLTAATRARADADEDRLTVGGYFRLQAFTDFQGGNGELGQNPFGCGFGGPCIYGRLMNEGPYGILEMRYLMLGSDKTPDAPWAAIYLRGEGDSFLGTDAGNGSLANYAITKFGVETGNLLLRNVTWRVGILWYEPNNMGLYDMFVDDLFYGVVGVSASYKTPLLDLLVGIGDEGWQLLGSHYDTVYTGGGWARFHLGSHFEIGGGGQFGYQPASPGNQNGPYQTPGVTYLEYYQQTAVQSFFQQNATPGMPFPNPVATSAENWKAVGYLGFGKLGPLDWNSVYFHYTKKPPLTNYQETYTPPGATAPQTYTIYISGLTSQEYELMIGDEALFHLIPHRLDLAIGGMYGEERNDANTIIAGTDNYTFASGVARLQYFLTQSIHLLVETSVAEEHSLNGNLFRDHESSIFNNDDGVPDPLGLQYGDSAYRDTWQGKWGIVFNPKGEGIYTRPSLRLLYGLQYSSQQDAFQSGYVNNLNQYNQFVGPEQHWHSVFGADLEGWF
jgi:hypothetical protein